jgi:hypothetical protein
VSDSFVEHVRHVSFLESGRSRPSRQTPLDDELRALVELAERFFRAHAIS